MASILLRRRRISASGVSRILQAVNGDSFRLDTESKCETIASLGVRISNYSSGKGTAKFDFTDLTRPHTWYPNARKKNRKVFLHVGPTNSGKTYHALKRLESSPSGIYCGPLRLLAWEVAKRLNKAKVPCDLITGQEKEEVDGAKHKAVTVEMADVTSDYQCAVIDEMQMLGCQTRGFSFTRALFGIAADELHLCGDPAAVPLIQELLKVTGDDVEKKIETGGRHLCSVVYGSLPPETRTRQATRFNDASSEFDVLVASDAIGMGLNLNISRIIFSTLKKFDGTEMRDLTIPEIKQIAGRAGRYGSKFPWGEVTCLDAEDLPLLHSSLKSTSPILEKAGVFPSFDLIYMYSRLKPKRGLYRILEDFLENAKLSENYFFANCEEILKVAAVIDGLPLSLQDKYTFCISPVDMNDEISSQGLTQFAQNYAKRGLVHLREIFTPGTLEVPKTPTALKDLESIHKVLELYVWLGFRFEESFPDHELASSQKDICSSLIEEFLERFGWQKPMSRKLTSNTKLNSLMEKLMENKKGRHLCD
ncbi:DExH-box ATP-dependent RNA helicase DExH16, mitochondrial isoform X2 [Hibiscus syriacus]|uniref:DExH-box ATP-dependent RNA helicase DExH16, mitochondrial isoform X2 n=1 Tax=Hibiscus syriacus TaxID=106335 RepID=UPI0019216CAF|nr:DExH-box ATP-dependent RNA helicase DExH16, mitochondrial isoform X2 [Hibiscus syriacus]